jgi:zinc protease
MMTNINKDNFEGRMEVTCATCHQGHSSPNRIPPLGAAAANSSNAPASSGGPGTPDPSMPKAEDLLAKYMTTIGGNAASNVKTVHLVGKIDGGDFKGTLDTTAKAPDKLLTVLTFEEGVFTQGFDGKTGWQKFGTNVNEINGTELATFRGSSPLFYLNPKLAYSNFRRVRKDTLNGKDVYVVDVQPGDDGMRIRLYFDAATNLMTRVWYGRQTVVGIVPEAEDYSDYRDVSGVKIPFTVVDTAGEGVRTITYSDIKTNEEVADSKFAKP